MTTYDNVLSDVIRHRIAAKLIQHAEEFYAPIIPIVMELHHQGLSLRAIGRELEQREIPPRYSCGPGGRRLGPGYWAAAQVRRVLLRGKAATASKSEDQTP